jgi:hemolysin III
MTPLLGITDPVSSLSHYLGALGILFAAGRLVPRVRGSTPRTLAVALYLVGVVGMFLASGTYHLLGNENPAREVFRHLDHAMIWVCITGTIAGIQVVARVGTRTTIGAVLAMGVVGLAVEQVALRGLPAWVSPVLYVAMGWVGLHPVVRLTREHGLRYSVPVLIAGLFSTLGAILDALEWPMIYPGVVEGHEVMHFMIAIGMGFFFLAVDRCTQIEHALNPS